MNLTKNYGIDIFNYYKDDLDLLTLNFNEPDLEVKLSNIPITKINKYFSYLFIIGHTQSNQILLDFLKNHNSLLFKNLINNF